MRRACKECRRVFEDEKECPVCKEDTLTRSFQGTVVIFDPKESIVAKKLNLTAPGEYALKV